MPITIGVNLHTRPRDRIDAYAWVSPRRCVDLAKSLGFTALRVDCGPSARRVESPSALDRLIAVMTAAADAQLQVQIVFTLPYGSNPTDSGAFADTPLGRYTQGKTLMTDTLLALPYAPAAIELENEVPIKAGMLYTQGQTLVEYDTPAFNAWADLMKGEYDAVRTVLPRTKIIVGTTNRNYAFIPWIAGKGINPDIVGYHLYERAGADLATWQGGGDWHAAMRAYGKPITVNELNGHQDGTAAEVGVTGAKSLRDVLTSSAPIESIHLYELFESDGSNHGLCDPYSDGFVRKPTALPLLSMIS
jgi:hypothetical protein